MYYTFEEIDVHPLTTALVTAFHDNHMVYIAGNGGSYDLACHMEEEFIGRCGKKKEPLPVIALKIQSAIANDFGYKHVFSRQLEAYGKKGDLFIPISTSGKSENLKLAIQIAKKKGMAVYEFPRDGDYTTEIIQQNQLVIMHHVYSQIDRIYEN